jgi:hypothetical protein
MYSQVGAPHFSGFRKEKKQQRNLEEGIFEYIDNGVYKCNNMSINIDTNNMDKITRIIISDDYEPGMEDLDKNGHENPLNFYYMNGQGKSHKDDLESSQFGTGFKSAALALCSHFTLYTRNKGIFRKRVMDFDLMEDEKDINDSYQPTEIRDDITEKEYRTIHPFQFGSSFILSKLDKTMFISGITLDQLCKFLYSKIQDTYNSIIKEKNINIMLNGIKVNPKKSYLDFDSVKPLTSEYVVFKANYNKNPTWIVKEVNGYDCYEKFYIFNIDKEDHQGRQGKRDLKIISEDDINEIKEYKNRKLEIKAGTLQFCPEFREDLKDDKISLPKGIAYFYKHGRKHGDFKKDVQDGNSNYIFISINSTSKEVATELGLTSSKDFKNKENDLTSLLISFIKKLRNKYNCNTRESNKIYKKNLEYISKLSKEKGFNIIKDEKKKKQENEDDKSSYEDNDEDSHEDSDDEPIISKKSPSKQPKSSQPSQPQPKSSQPSQPQPKSSQPSQPQPSQPQPKSSQPSQQQPSQPQPKSSQPSQPQPSQPQPKSSQPSQPQPSQPQPKSSQPSQPQPSQPQPSQPQPKSSQPSQPQQPKSSMDPLNVMISKQEAIDVIRKIGKKNNMPDELLNNFIEEWKVEIDKI